MLALDTNVLVRLLVDDDKRQARAAEQWLATFASPARPAYIDHVVLCELAWVLDRSYGYAREDVHTALAALVQWPSVSVEAPELVRQALTQFLAGPADFSDYLLAARAHAAGFGPVLTFDTKAAKSQGHRLLKA
jgi:predicted nucleic-acid-binding protein